MYPGGPARADVAEPRFSIHNHQGNFQQLDEHAVVSEVLRALRCNAEKVRGTISQCMLAVQTEVLDVVQATLAQMQKENDEVLRQMFSSGHFFGNSMRNDTAGTGELDGWATNQDESDMLPQGHMVPVYTQLRMRYNSAIGMSMHPRTCASSFQPVLDAYAPPEEHQQCWRAHHHVQPKPQQSEDEQSEVMDASERSRCRQTNLQRAKTASFLTDENPSKKARRAGFIADQNEMKEQVRELLAKQSGNSAVVYKDTGIAQRIAKSSIFDNVGLFVIFVNAFWIAFDTDMNSSLILSQSEAIFQVAEHMFCTWFVAEWTVRFLAFKFKKAALLDMWFAFDTSLVVLVVFETWVLNLMLSLIVLRGESDMNSGGKASILKVLRLARLSRVARCVRILRSFPELVILIKGLWVASRSVMFTLFLLFFIIYVFAIAFRQMTDGSAIGDKYFASVPQAIASLLLRGTLPDLAEFVSDVGGANLFVCMVLFLFILVATLTVMNMLVGVLVEVVKVVSAVEQEELMVSFVKTRLFDLVEQEALDGDSNGMLRKDEFTSVLTNHACCRFIRDCGVDVLGLVEIIDLIYRDTEEIPLFAFVELILQLRGSNNATVKDLVDMRKFMMQEMRNLVQDIVSETKKVLDESSHSVRPPSAKVPRRNTVANGSTPEDGPKSSAGESLRHTKSSGQGGKKTITSWTDIFYGNKRRDMDSTVEPRSEMDDGQSMKLTPDATPRSQRSDIEHSVRWDAGSAALWGNPSHSTRRHHPAFPSTDQWFGMPNMRAPYSSRRATAPFAEMQRADYMEPLPPLPLRYTPREPPVPPAILLPQQPFANYIWDTGEDV